MVGILRFSFLGLGLFVTAWPAFACETAPDISQLPGESQKEAQTRYNKTHDDQWVIRSYNREAHSFEKAKVIYIAKVISNNRGEGAGAKPSSRVQPIESIRGTLPTDQRMLTEVLGHSCSDFGDGYGDSQGSAAKVGTLVIVFEGLTKSEAQPNGIDSLNASSVRTHELLDPLYKHGKEIPEDVLWGRKAPEE